VGWYEPLPPGPDLARVLACVWSARPTGTHLLVPDACVDLLWLDRGELWLCGPETSAWTFALPEGTSAVGVRFRPGVAPWLFGFDAAAVADRRVRWRAIVGEHAERALLRDLAGRRDDRGRLDALEDAVLGRLRAVGGAAVDPVAETVLERVVADPWARAVAVAGACGLTPRQLQRRCRRSFGYGVATLARLVRFQRFWSLVALTPERPLAALAASAGYADHAHLGRDCRAITGMPPRRFLEVSFGTFPDMSDPYKTAGGLVGTLRG
jgi:AraC-like DNA-binding protein